MYICIIIPTCICIYVCICICIYIYIYIYVCVYVCAYIIKFRLAAVHRLQLHAVHPGGHQQGCRAHGRAGGRPLLRDVAAHRLRLLRLPLLRERNGGEAAAVLGAAAPPAPGPPHPGPLYVDCL